MALWWLCGGYVFQVVVKPEILIFKIKFDLEGQGQPLPSQVKSSQVFYFPKQRHIYPTARFQDLGCLDLSGSLSHNF